MKLFKRIALLAPPLLLAASVPAVGQDAAPAAAAAKLKHPAILVFSKTKGYRHVDAIPAANALFEELAKAQGWSIVESEDASLFTPESLARFDALVFNNISGNVFDESQRAALKAYLEQGGGFVGIHGTGGDPAYDWRWYVDELIGAQFIGHPMNPQFQQATIHVEDAKHPATKGLPKDWVRTEEWYSFAKSARKPGFNILATLDEKTYSPKLGTKDLSMGADHPIAWSHCVGSGRAFYSALGHRAEAYAEPEYRRMLLGATRWASRQEGSGCGTVKKRR